MNEIKETSIKINNSKVFVNGEEVFGLKKFKYLFLTYSLLPLIFVLCISIPLLITGIAVTFSFSLIALFIMFSLFLSFKSVFRKTGKEK